jgi:hypothetical protein
MKKIIRSGWIIPPMLLAVAIVLRFAGCMNSQDAPISEVALDPDGMINPNPVPIDLPDHDPFKYKLTLKGLKEGKTVPLIDPDKDPHKIYVPLYGSTRINLTEGDFQVLDWDGTDGSALFQLPNPDPTNSGVSEYSVYVKRKAKSGRGAVLTTCAEDDSGSTFCSLNSVVFVKHGKKLNATKYLLYLYADIDTNGTVDRVPLFDARLQNYYWEYDNDGVKKAVLKFKHRSTLVP